MPFARAARLELAAQLGHRRRLLEGEHALREQPEQEEHVGELALDSLFARLAGRSVNGGHTYFEKAGNGG